MAHAIARATRPFWRISSRARKISEMWNEKSKKHLLATAEICVRAQAHNVRAKSTELGKVFVAQCCWSILVEAKPSQEVLEFHGTFTPAVRVSDANTSSAIAAVLENVASVVTKGDRCQSTV